MEVSVVIPVYNGEAWIAETLESILAQTRQAAEVIVIDDGSTDGTPDIVKRFGPRVTHVRQANAGVQASRNHGIAIARGDWIALCDADDLWLPGYLQANADLLAADPAIELIFTNFRILRGQELEPEAKFDQAPAGWLDAMPHRAVPQGWIFDGSIAGTTFRFHPMFPSSTVIMKSLIDRVGAFDPRMRGLRNEDGEFMLRCLYQAKTAAVPEPLVYIRRHGGNSSADLVLRLQDEIASLRFIRAHHAEAKQYWPTIDWLIAHQQGNTIERAFSTRDHATVLRMFEELPASERSLKVWVKVLIARLPDFLGHRLNVVLQRLVSGKVEKEGRVIR